MKPFTFLFSQMYNVAPGVTEGRHVCSSTWCPAVDVYQRKDAIVLVVELPGVDRDRLDVTIEGGMLRIKGHREARVPEGVTHVHQMEIPYGPFVRLVRLPDGTNVDQIEAKYDEGFLTVEIPKKGTR
jgi:HSP20 family protein